MRRHRPIAALLAALVLACAADAAPDAAGGRELAQRFGATLRTRLETAIAAGGPAHAVTVCSHEAAGIAAALAAESGWTLGRRSLKARNPANRPDAWERVVLEEFERERAAGTDPATLERIETVAAPGGSRVRYMKAIPTQPLCLACHGEALAPDVEAAIAAAYPRDTARGYRVGEIRGAFSFSVAR